jgi:hypothetical protein
MNLRKWRYKYKARSDMAKIHAVYILDQYGHVDRNVKVVDINTILRLRHEQPKTARPEYITHDVNSLLVYPSPDQNYRVRIVYQPHDKVV